MSSMEGLVIMQCVEYYKNRWISLKLSNTESFTDTLKEPEEIHTD